MLHTLGIKLKYHWDILWCVKMNILTYLKQLLFLRSANIHLLLRLRWIKRNKILIKGAMELEISIILENID